MDSIHPTIVAFLDAWRRLDQGAYVGAFAPVFRTQDPYGAVDTIEAVLEHYREVEENWEQLDYRLTDAVADGSRTAIAYTIEMTGRAGGWEGQRVVLNCMAMVEVINDRIVSWNEIFDTGVLRRARLKTTG